MVVSVTTIHFHYQVVTILGSNVHFNSSDVHYSVFTVGCSIQEVHITGLPFIPELSLGVLKSKKWMNQAFIVSDIGISYICVGLKEKGPVWEIIEVER